MATFLITYDIRSDNADEAILNEDYSDLREAIGSLGTAGMLQQSVWMLLTDKIITDIREYLGKHIRDMDSLLIVQIMGEHRVAWKGFGRQEDEEKRKLLELGIRHSSTSH